jgi:zinc protease
MRPILKPLLLVLALAACATAPKPSPTSEPASTTKPPPTSPEAWRQTPPPAPAEPLDLVTPTFQQGRLDNGLTVLVSERHDLPLVAMAVAFSWGSSVDPEGKAGLASLTYKLLLEGAGKRDAVALDRAFADLGSSPFVSLTQDGASLGTRVLTRNVDPALALLADLAQRPTLRPQDFERKKKEHLADLALQAGSPGYLTGEALVATIYGEAHPYGQLSSGTPDTVARITAQDARRFYQAAASPQAAALVLVGDLTLEQGVAWAKAHFGKWAGKGGRPPVPPKPPAAPTQPVLVPKPGLNQTTIAMGRAAISHGHPDEAALELASAVFGGQFTSRLNLNLREDKGYSYGAGSYLDARRGPGPLVAQSSVRADVTGAALKEFYAELEGLAARPIAKGELEPARQGLIRGLPARFVRVEDLLRAAAGLFWAELPLDEYQRLADRLEKATLKEVQEAAVRYFRPGELSLVLVGDPDVVAAQLGPLDLPTPKVRPPPSVGPGPKARP